MLPWSTAAGARVAQGGRAAAQGFVELLPSLQTRLYRTERVVCR